MGKMHYSYPLKSSKNDQFVTIEETPSDFSDTKFQQKSRPSRSLGGFLKGWIWRFFPWIGEPPAHQLDILHKQASVCQLFQIDLLPLN